MAKKKSADLELDFAFYQFLHQFYQEKKGSIKNNYRNLTKKFLDYNDPGQNEQNAYLRVPQFEALEMYIFLKEFLDNEPVHKVFEDWYKEQNKFKDRLDTNLSGKQVKITEEGKIGYLDSEAYEKLFNEMKKNAQEYANYIFALTMGTGKTILMATCIFYEFILANKFPKDAKYCHNALVFAPDKTVLESLREITTFDKNLVVPPEYVSWLETHLKIHFLDDTGIALSTLDGSKFNIIISNTQKIILKQKHKDKNPAEKLFMPETTGHAKLSAADEPKDEEIVDEADLQSNQRFTKLTRLQQLGIYVDEAHHSFGDQLSKDLGMKKAKNSLRLTINELAASLKKEGTQVVACYNYTGTPYVGNKVLPEVVYAYGLKEAIDNQYLKDIEINDFSNTKSKEFLKIVIQDFWQKYGKDGDRYEGMLPKLAIFGTTIEEVKNELQPIVSEILGELGISLDKILVNVGDPKLTSNDDIREFNRLDSPHSNKQFVILVNKGREGWNCRSLFGVSLFRKPKSKVFVLQATMRCLRAIGNEQYRATVYLSNENREILENELQENFRLGISDLKNTSTNKEVFEIKVVPPVRKIKLNRIKKLYQWRRKDDVKKIDFNIAEALDSDNIKKYKLIHTKHEGLSFDRASIDQEQKVDITHVKEKATYSSFTLVGEIARYLNESPIVIGEMLKNTEVGVEKIVEAVNQYNELLYDWIVPKIIESIYELKDFENQEEEEIELVKNPKAGHYIIHANPELVVSKDDRAAKAYAHKSFHLDTYCFDSRAESKLFWNLLRSELIEEVYFTGMLTHGQTDFYIQYIDPETRSVRSYYPDFYVKRTDGQYYIVEVKGDNQIEDPVVKAKAEAAAQLATVSAMKYEVIKSTDIEKGVFGALLT
ncbi:TnsA endonuclease N-terminal domain-containing protein [Serpentinicella sp. ANB-PHB4]|uniref:TnsA endonuclease N-terminal domain-containing protein n=1 Tax=Serpentinicella sp. ANB-PHB4 TaxID=3074076 RepID=UPI0028644621|nr:TnsA endonuclease N-terminal domain-containing protein [Serpentinicella sp. ANB-PHB4]MDR5659977.1 TnsA endonuclease N-terminal domain-containing protein [Serpentinicella sp. ANB-PHB4]